MKGMDIVEVGCIIHVQQVSHDDHRMKDLLQMQLEAILQEGWSFKQ